MTVTVLEYTNGWRNNYFKLKFTDSSDKVGITFGGAVISNYEWSPNYLLYVAPFSKDHSIKAEYTINYTSPSSHFMKLGSELIINSPQNIKIPLEAEILRFSGVDDKSGGFISVYTNRPISYIHSDSVCSLKPYSNNLDWLAKIEKGESKVLGSQVLLDGKYARQELFNWEYIVISGKDKINITKNPNNKYYFTAERIEDGEAQVQIIVNPIDGSKSLTEIITIN